MEANKKHKYANAAHFDLICKVVPLREAFRAMRRDQAAREQIANEELSHWLAYVDRRKEVVSKEADYWI